jgi:hypothetical protein
MGLSWQITPRVLTDAMARGGEVAKRAFEAMMTMKKIDVAKIKDAIGQCNVKTAQFTVILIGKDGTEKHRTNTLLQMQELFTIIDAMPMRRAEMGKKN